jgi:capsular polysaccharide biosynthesis protein
MLKRNLDILRGHAELSSVFLSTVFGVFFLVFALSAATTLLSPASYVGTGRLRLGTLPFAEGGTRSSPIRLSQHRLIVRTECQILKSDAVLDQAISDLGSAEAWARESQGWDPVRRRSDRLAQLRSQLAVRPAREDGEIEVRATAGDWRQAARLAEAVMHAYREERLRNLEPTHRPPGIGESDSGSQVFPSVTVEQASRLVNVGRGAWGALMLGVGAGAAVAWRLLRKRRLPAPAGIFVPVFLVIFCLVLGPTSLFGSLDIAVGTAAGLWLASMGAAIAHWTAFLRKRFPLAPRMFPTVFWAVLLLSLSFEALSQLFNPYWYSSTAIVEVRLDQPTPAAGKFSPDQPFLLAECQHISSKEMLGRLVDTLNVPSPWRSRMGFSFGRHDRLLALKGSIRVAPLRGTTLLAINALDLNPHESAQIANTLAEFYRESRINSPASGTARGQAVVTIINRASPPQRPLRCDGSSLTAFTIYATMLAWVAGGGAVLGAWLTTRKGGKFRVFVPTLLLPTILLTLLLAAFAPPALSASFTILIVPLFLFFLAAGAAWLFMRTRKQIRSAHGRQP